RRRHTRFSRDWSSDVCSSDLVRIWSQQTALNAFKEASESRAAGQSSSDASGSSLADILYAGSNDDDGYEDTSLATLIATLQRQEIGSASCRDSGQRAREV